MVRNKKKLSYIKQISILSVVLVVIANILSTQSSIVVLDNFNQELLNNPLEDTLNTQLIDVPDGVGGYSVLGASSFTTIQNASSSIMNQDYFANETNYFNISTPTAWNATSQQFNIESYTKEQIIADPLFMSEFVNGTTFWEEEKLSTGKGYITQYPLFNNIYGKTRIWNNKKEEDPAFNKGDYAYWTHEFDNLNPDNLEIQKGRIYQEEDEHIWYSSRGTSCTSSSTGRRRCTSRERSS